MPAKFSPVSLRERPSAHRLRFWCAIRISTRRTIRPFGIAIARGHADFGFDRKFGFRDPRGGGRSSGRETIGRVIGGAIAAKLLAEFGIHAFAYVSAVGEIEAERFEPTACAENPLGMPDPEARRGRLPT